MRHTRILVVKLSSLGDLIHALPAVHAVKSGLGAEIHWVTQPEYIDLVGCFDDVTKAIPFPRRRFWSGLAGFRRALQVHRYDAVIDLQGLLKSALVTVLARADRRIGPSRHREGAGWFYDNVAAPAEGGRHAVRQALTVCRCLDVDVGEIAFPLTFPPIGLQTPHPRIAFVPCSRWASKNWAPMHFLELARELIDRLDASVFLLGGPDEAEQTTCRMMEETVPALHNWCGKTTIPQMGGLLSAMDAAVTVDTGPMHIAAAVGTPVVAVFGPTDPALTGPYGPRHRVIRAPGAESIPDRSRWRSTSPWLINRVPVQEVLDAVLNVLGHGGGTIRA